MKNIFKQIIVKILEIEARAVLWRFKPKIVGVTGSVGKTSTKDAIYVLLKQEFHTRKSEKSFNSEIGVPLTILGLHNPWGNIWGWLRVIAMGVAVLFTKKKYPQWLVLEIGADRPGDIQKITSWLKCDVAVITRFSKTPVHIEYFKNTEELIYEKSWLIKSVKENGTVILNIDDPWYEQLKNLTKRSVISYGLSDRAVVMGSHTDIFYSSTSQSKKPLGMDFRINVDGTSIPVKILGALGRQHVYPVLAGAAVAYTLKINLVSAVESLATHATAPGRMKIIDGINGSIIIDDTYNSSPVALDEALETLGNLNMSRKKIAVLGDMLELGRYSTEAHRIAGEKVATKADILFTFGMRSNKIAEAAVGAGMNNDNVIVASDKNDIVKKILPILGVGDVVLVKGSQSMRFEKIVEGLMEKPEDALSLLVRQDAEWKRR